MRNRREQTRIVQTLVVLLAWTGAAWAQEAAAAAAATTPATTPAATTTKAAATTTTAADAEATGCPPDQVSFELVTGFVYTAPADMLDSQPGTLMLTDCIDTCRKNASCKSINYETGLCVLFSSNADDTDGQLTASQFPVFTIYVQKNCLPAATACKAAWAFERVMNYELKAEVKKRGKANTRQNCLDLCLAEKDFFCRSALFSGGSGDCRLLEQDRETLAGEPAFDPTQGVDYLEVNCAPPGEPDKLCVYEQTKGKILKTVDSVFQAIASREDCEDLCNNAPFRCHSYDFNDTGDSVCRLSHHSAYSLTQVEDPYLAIEEATTYEKRGCYNVSIDCHSGDMTATITTTTVFNGKLYAKGSPVNCMVDVDNALSFSITMGYNDLECGVEREGSGTYKNDVIIQHHDRIVTSSDLGLALTCQYDLANKSVSNMVDLAITGEISPSLYEEATVDSPNVAMRVENANGESTKTATVGDPLALIFEILDEDSPYEILVRDLVALDGATDTELLLIDDRGCPADPSIMSELRKVPDSKTLTASFDAFRFPTSQMVQFRAMVTPCLQNCTPANCDIRDYTGQIRTVESYGRKRRDLPERIRRSAKAEEVLVVQTLQIVDKMGKRKKSEDEPVAPASDHFDFDNSVVDSYNVDSARRASNDFSVEGVYSVEHRHGGVGGRCVDDTSLIAGAIVFIVLQVLLIVVWTVLWRRKRAAMAKSVLLLPSSASSDGAASVADSLSYIYDSGITRRLQ